MYEYARTHAKQASEHDTLTMPCCSVAMQYVADAAGRLRAASCRGAAGAKASAAGAAAAQHRSTDFLIVRGRLDDASMDPSLIRGGRFRGSAGFL